MHWLFISCLLLTINNILWKKYLHATLTVRVAFIRAIYTSLIMAGLYFFMEGDFMTEIQSPDFYIILISCLFGATGLYALITYLKNGRLYNLGYYNMVAIGITGLYTWFFQKDQVNGPWFFPALGLLALGYLVFVNIKNNQQGTISKNRRDHILLWTMVLSFTFALITQSMAVSRFSFVTVAFTQELVVLFLAGLAILLFSKTKQDRSFRLFSWQPIVMAVVIIAAVLTSLYGLQLTSPLASSMFGLLVPLLTFFGGVFVFKEKTRLVHIFALVLMIGGALLLMV